MLPIILALAGGYLIVDSQKDKLKFEDGGMMAKGGETFRENEKVSVRIKPNEFVDFIKRINLLYTYINH